MLAGVPAPPAAPPATRMSVPQGNTSTVQGAVRTRASVNRPPTATRPATFRPIAPAPHIPNPNNVGSAVYVARNARLSQVGSRR